MPDPAPVVASVVSPTHLLEKVLPRYDLGQVERCRFFQRGLNDTYELTTSQGRFFLRIYRKGWRSRREIEAELAMIDHLRDDGLPVSHALTRRDGRRISRIAAPEGTRWAVVFASAPGRPPTMDLAHSTSYGELVARLHESWDRMRPGPARFHIDATHLIDDSLAAIRRQFGHRRSEMEGLHELGAGLREAITRLEPGSAPGYGACHGDHHGGNVHVDDDGRLTLFDFDCGGFGWRSYDIAVFLWSRTLKHGVKGQGRAKATRRYNAFLRGYESVRALTAGEKKSVPIFVAARHIWLMGMHVGGADRWGHHFVQDAYLDRCLAFLGAWARREKLLG